MNESERAVMESARFAAMESYFEARPQIFVTTKLERIFEAGFDAGYAKVAKMRETAKVIGELEQLATISNNDLLVENDRLRAELAAREWRTIESAPKDGRAIIVVGNNFGDRIKGIHVCVAKFTDGYFYKTGDDFDFDFESGCFLEHLTHWMPLPPDPKP